MKENEEVYHKKKKVINKICFKNERKAKILKYRKIRIFHVEKISKIFTLKKFPKFLGIKKFMQVQKKRLYP